MTHPAGPKTDFVKAMTLTDATMLVAGTMIGSGIFIVSADMSRTLGSPGWLLIAWLLTGVMTLLGALAYGELAAMYPRAGGMYTFLRESMSPLMGSSTGGRCSSSSRRDHRGGGGGVRQIRRRAVAVADGHSL